MTRPAVTVAACLGLLAAGGAAMLVIRHFGLDLEAPPPTAGGGLKVGAGTGKGHVLFHVLVALATVIALGRVLGLAFK